MRYDPIMCMMVNDSVKTRDAGGFAPGSKAKITVENEGTQYETYSVEYAGQPLKRGFKTREAAKNYAKSQGLTTDSAIDEVIKTCDFPYVGKDELKSVIENLENLSSRVKAVSDRASDKDSPALKRASQDIKEIANQLRFHLG